MPASPSVTLSLRIPDELKTRLERAAIRTKRSRAFLTIEALEKHLDAVEENEIKANAPGVYDLALKYRGIGAKILGRTRSAKEIDALIREMRGDD